MKKNRTKKIQSKPKSSGQVKPYPQNRMKPMLLTPPPIIYNGKEIIFPTSFVDLDFPITG
jgi:hypothetical protein